MQKETLTLIIYSEIVVLSALLIVIGVLKIWLLMRKIVAVAALSVATDKTTYSRGETVSISGSLTLGGNPQPGQTVSFAITPPAGDIISLDEVTTDENGLYKTEWPIPGDAAEGTYKLTAGAMGESATAAFTLKSS